MALAATLVAPLDLNPRRVALAPPLLYSGGRWRIAELGIDWELAPHQPAARP